MGCRLGQGSGGGEGRGQLRLTNTAYLSEGRVKPDLFKRTPRTSSDQFAALDGTIPPLEAVSVLHTTGHISLRTRFFPVLGGAWGQGGWGSNPTPGFFLTPLLGFSPGSHTSSDWLQPDDAGSTGERTGVAMHAIADAVTQCKFEATDPAADEVVLYKILQVSLPCLSATVWDGGSKSRSWSARVAASHCI